MTSRLGARLREMMQGESQRLPPVPFAGGIGSGESSPGIPIDVISGDATPQTVGQRLARAAAHALGGSVHDTSAGPCVIVERVYDHHHLHGLFRIGECACHVHHDAPGFRILAGPRGR